MVSHAGAYQRHAKVRPLCWNKANMQDEIVKQRTMLIQALLAASNCRMRTPGWRLSMQALRAMVLCGREEGHSLLKSNLSILVVAPGGGTGINSSVYSELNREDNVSVKILGKSRAPYDRYPAAWGAHGAPPPNLETFALDLAVQKCVDEADCLIVGSRGGQVVLPTLWNAQVHVPPTIVMNGGCAASSLPIAVSWPENAISLLLIGGNDYFRGHRSVHEYLQDTRRQVPSSNGSTAILLVNEMTHMPQARLLSSILSTMIYAVTLWRSSRNAPLDDFQSLLKALREGGWSGVLSFKAVPGDVW
eukprot:CAMPEP_0169260782 /NCGR_PEP_ID=MMETSP1016-20121227/42705_1 /TAXON_ID=342587 /ORGANISM="Karlodinium micrum, Strain CCMP2283" /LENGTH=303 /DNA_ID=CAMNT_0009342959 /DNA_START=153 /DNA_END=1061 /DNA_ORIENTATION=+